MKLNTIFNAIETYERIDGEYNKIDKEISDIKSSHGGLFEAIDGRILTAFVNVLDEALEEIIGLETMVSYYLFECSTSRKGGVYEKNGDVILEFEGYEEFKEGIINLAESKHNAGV